MSAEQLLSTSLLLGAFVLFAGCYGLFYCLGKFRTQRSFARAATLSYVLQGVIAALLALGPLELKWKALVLVSFIAYAVVPPLTWRFLERLHHLQEQRS